MPKRSSKEEIKDINQLAKSIIDETTKEQNDKEPSEEKAEKNPAAVALGRLGGLKGGKARAEKLSEKRRKEIAHTNDFNNF